MEFFWTTFLGVVSGVITTVLLSIVYVIFRKIITPWIEEITYKGVNVSGRWHYTTSRHEGHNFEITLDLKQRAQRVTGTLSAKTTRPDTEYINHYQITRGEVSDNQLLFTYRALLSDRTGLGSFLLKVTRGGTELIGGAVYVADADDDAISVKSDLEFKRS